FDALTSPSRIADNPVEPFRRNVALGEAGESGRKPVDGEMGILQQARGSGRGGAQGDRDGEIRFGSVVCQAVIVTIDPEGRGLGEQGGSVP
ncbi:hypothetical protein, partial [Brachybacterium alimentarium]|uniref:hypothetical protein n=1 Tax=Brachybacterium alimentarium TaxID=47845 RepID=UPI0015CE5072